ncbi:MAG: hypothetical protein HC822_01750 [Oscillochloris sp.]|nr:hypothetical protein [Oscillochloris sp.]
MKTYRLSRAGRRLILALLVGALLIWLFAIWSFVNTLGISLNPLALPASLSAALRSGLGIAEIVPALLMLVLIIANPLLIWNLLEEWSAGYTPSESGLCFESLGVRLDVPWSLVRGLESDDDDRDEPRDELVLSSDVSTQITNPLVRFLHRQAFGSARLPIYSGVADRDELLGVIRRNSVPAVA